MSCKRSTIVVSGLMLVSLLAATAGSAFQGRGPQRPRAASAGSRALREGARCAA
jgi:hypothetical protein